MKLHKHKERFIELIRAASKHYGIPAAQVERDYFVTLFLRRASEKIPGLLFKGGLCLSKCNKAIDRLSEDVDLTLDADHFTQAPKREANKAIVAIADKLGFVIADREAVEKRSFGDYNAYTLIYPTAFPTEGIRPEICVKMTFLQKSYPDSLSAADSYIGEYLREIGQREVAEQYDLRDFPIRVQTLKRTFVDKVFALCDYYMSGQADGNSKHIYDLYRLLSRVDVNELTLRLFVEKVRRERKKSRGALSAQDGVRVSALLGEIAGSEFYRKDYERVTSKLLLKPVPYEVAITALKQIADSKAFD